MREGLTVVAGIIAGAGHRSAGATFSTATVNIGSAYCRQFARVKRQYLAYATTLSGVTFSLVRHIRYVLHIYIIDFLALIVHMLSIRYHVQASRRVLESYSQLLILSICITRTRKSIFPRKPLLEVERLYLATSSKVRTLTLGICAK